MMKTLSKKETCDGWKSYPIRLTMKTRTSECCKQPLVLVESMEGGFVSANCLKCNKKETLSYHEFETLPLTVCCPDCKETMVSRIIAQNYSYLCEKCGSYIGLSDLLPNWQELK